MGCGGSKDDLEDQWGALTQTSEKLSGGGGGGEGADAVASAVPSERPPFAVADAPASGTGAAATLSASAEPKPPSQVASKEEAKQPPPTSASKSKLGFSMSSKVGSKTGDFSVLSSASGSKVGGQSTLSAASGTGGSSCAQSAISGPSFGHWRRRNSLCLGLAEGALKSGRRETTFKSGLQGGSEAATADFFLQIQTGLLHGLQSGLQGGRLFSAL